MEMKGDKSHDTDHWVKQEQNQGAVYLGRVNKGRLNPAHLPPQTSNKLLQRGEQRELSITPRLCRRISTNYSALLLWRSEIAEVSLVFHGSGIFHTRRGAAAFRITCPPIIIISPSRRDAELIGSALGVTTPAEGYGGRRFVCVFQWVGVTSEHMLHHCRYRSLQTISQMLIEVIKAAASRGSRCRC